MLKKWLIAFCVLISVPALSQEKWDLKKSVEYALANNISVKQQDIQAKLAELTYHQSKLSKYPNLNFNTNLGVNTGRNIDRTTNQFTTAKTFYNTLGLQSNVDVFNFGSKKNTIQANLYEMQAAIAAVEKFKDDIALNVSGAYLQILLNRELVAINRLQVKQTSSQLENTRKQVRAGSVPELNAAQLDAQLALDSSNLVSAIGLEQQSLLFLKALLNFDAGAPFDIVTPPIGLIPVLSLAELQPEMVYGLALKNLPQQRVNSLRLLSAQKNADAARGAMYPSVSLGAGIDTRYSSFKGNADVTDIVFRGVNPIGFGIVKGTNDTVQQFAFDPVFRTYSDPYFSQLKNNFGTGAGFSVSVPIFNGGSAKTNWQRAKLNIRNYELLQEQDKLNLKNDIYKAYTDAVTSLQKFNASVKAIEAAQKAYDFSVKRFDIGLLNPLDLITAQSNLFRVQLEKNFAQFDYVFKMKVLEFYKGEGLKL